MAITRICFVCSGNICRSPLAEGIFKQQTAQAGLADQFHIESFGIGPWHVGEPPDRRAQQTARQHGLTLTGRAQQFKARDFARFDQVWALDGEVADFLRQLAPSPADRQKVRLLREHDPERAPAHGRDTELDVPDPYYGGPEGFEEAYGIIERAGRGLLDSLRRDQETP
jgi:protein-tyrosine phosphatase